MVANRTKEEVLYMLHSALLKESPEFVEIIANQALMCDVTYIGNNLYRISTIDYEVNSINNATA